MSNVQISVLSNILKNVLLMIIDALEANTQVDNKQIVESQQKIISIIQKLKETKEIQ
jgi:flagellar motor switch protein FliG